MDDSSIKIANDRDRHRRDSRFTSLFHGVADNHGTPGWIVSFKMACILSFPIFTSLPCAASQAGLVSTMVALLVVGVCSSFACKMIVGHSIVKDRNILDIVARLLGGRYRMIFLLAGGLHYILVGSIFLREST